jgi:hypothetical protein
MSASTLTTATVTLVPQGTTAAVAATVTYVSANNTVMLDPAADLAGNTTYTMSVKGGTAGAKDVAGNALSADAVWTFTTGAPTDTTAPTVTAVSPGNGTTGVPLTTNGTATFSEAMNTSTLSSSTVTLVAQGSTSPVAASIFYSAATKTVTVDPAVDLTGNTLYTATIKGGTAGAKDLAGNALAADRVWTFTTAPPPDTTAPTVTAVSPVSGSTGVPQTVNLTATFSEAMNASALTSSTVTLVAQGSASPVAATVAYASATKTVTLDPTVDLTGNTFYTATIKGGTAGAKDLAGNALAADKVWTFTTGSLETISYLSDRPWTKMVNGWGPAERDRSNADLAAGDGLPLTLDGVTFPKGLGTHAASDVRFALNGACSTFTAVVGVDDEVAANGNVVFQVWTDGIQRYDSGPMTGGTSRQSVSVPVTGVTELALIVTDGGDGVDYDHADWADAKVSCSDTIAPTVSATSPPAGATAVAVSTNPTATFSEPMNAATLTTATVLLVAQGSSMPVAAAVTYDSSAQIVTVDPSASLATNTVYTATIKGGAGGAKDLAGNALATDKVWTFTTAAAATVPAGTEIFPGDDIQSRVNAGAAGATFILKAGVHRGQTITPKTGQIFVGETGTILSGAKALTSFTRSGAAWVASNQTQQGAVSGSVADGICKSTNPRCGYPEDLFINDTPLQHVASLTNGGPGKWFFDYAADKIYFWDDPTGKIVETSVTPVAFVGSASSGVTIRGLTIEKYAAPTQEAAVNLGNGWIIEDSEVRWNHAGGIWTGPYSKSLRNFVHHNGCFGFNGAGENILVEGNQISYNNYAGYDSFWGAGGSKWVYTTNLVVRGNFSHHNFGPGLWTDINNVFTLYENNIVEDNQRGGIFHEISYDAIIRNNTLRRNGTGKDFPYWTTGAGIEVVSSPNVEVYGNTLVDNWQGITGLDDHRGTGNRGTWTLTNLYVHDNTVTSLLMDKGSGRTGVVDTAGTGAFSTTANNRFRQNGYTLGVNAQYFMWLSTDRTETEWRSFGMDTTGTFQR